MKEMKNKNVSMLLFLIITLCVLMMFLTSKIWLPDDRKMMSVDKVMLQNRLFTKVYEQYDDTLIEIKLSSPKMLTQYEQTPLLDMYKDIKVTINNKKNEAVYSVFYVEEDEVDSIVIQVPYTAYVQDTETLYYVDIHFDKTAYIQADYRKLSYVYQVKQKHNGYIACLSTQQQYAIIIAELEKIDIDNATDDMQREAITKAKIELEEAKKRIESEVTACLERYTT